MNTDRALTICLAHHMNAWIIPNGVAVEVELCTASGNWLKEVVPCFTMQQVAETLGY